MWERIRTALVLLVVVGVAMFATRQSYLILPLLFIMAGVSAFEFAKLLPTPEQNPQHYTPPATQIPVKPTQTSHYIYAFVVLAIVVVVIGGFVLTNSANLITVWAGFWAVASVLWCMIVAWVMRYPNRATWYNKGLYAIGVVLLVATVTAMYYLWLQSAWWLLYVFVLVWCADSGAYFVGRKLGKRKMSPHVSPNKSVEGLMGGLATGVLVVLGVAFGVLKNWSGMAIGLFLVLSLVTIVISVFGDLFESMLKRHAGVKDAGNLLPGHGGVLDRIDSQLSAMPVFALGFWAMHWFNMISLG